MNKIGVLIGVRPETDIFAEIKKVKDIGGECCQITIWNPSLYNDNTAEAIISASEKYGVEISTLWAGWSGPAEWNFTAGPMTLGIVPEAYRMKRLEELIMGADFAVKIGVKRMATHVGFLPENINDPQYYPVLGALRHIVRECKTEASTSSLKQDRKPPSPSCAL